MADDRMASIRRRYPRAYAKWSAEEDALLEQKYKEGEVKVMFEWEAVRRSEAYDSCNGNAVNLDVSRRPPCKPVMS
jgi:hypothetical protein